MSLDFTPSAETKAKQCHAILQALRLGPLSSVDARERLSILHPAGRIYDLRRAGYCIVTRASVTFDAAGQPHRAALWCLEPAT